MLANQWFEKVYIKLNEDKCHFLLLRYKQETFFTYIWRSKVWEREILGGTTEKKSLIWTTYSRYNHV